MGLLCLGMLMVGMLSAPAIALEENSGVNLSLEEGFGARHQAMALRFAGFGQGADAVGNAPASMNDVDDLTFSSAHAERFAEAQLDHFAMILPLDAASTLGVALARYGVSDIEWRPEGSEATAVPPALFNTADYWVTAAFARRLGRLDLGASLQLIYRDLDQSGMGLRGDLMAALGLHENLRVQAMMVGALPSSARWSSGLNEFESPDLRLALVQRGVAPYLYGRWQVAFETEGLFQKTAKSSRSLNAYRGALHPVEAFGTANLGGEFLFDFGLALRAGLEEIRFSRTLGDLWHAGLGYTFRGMVGLDYSFTPHPDLPSSHRIALQWTPVFPRFSGKNYRGAAPKAVVVPTRASENRPTESKMPESKAVIPTQGEPTQADPTPTSPAPATPAAQEAVPEKETLEKEELEVLEE
jgi:hypothetical protein